MKPLLWLIGHALAARPVVPISVIIPCNVEDFHFLPLVLASIANQTALPQETILVANLPQPYAEGVLLIDTTKQNKRRESTDGISSIYDTADNDNIFTWLFENISGNSNQQNIISEEPRQDLFRSPVELALPAISGFAAPIPGEALESLIRSLPDAKQSIAALPRLKVYVRAGVHYAGANRVFGGLHASTDLVSFFDADDYMHPQRIQRLWEIFSANRDLEALITAYTHFKISEWPTRIPSLLSNVYDGNSTKLVFSYKDFWNALPKYKLSGSHTEPSYDNPNNYSWWFPKDMDLRWPTGVLRQGHNGWLTIKKRILAEVQYPDIRRGQDSLYNWRLISAHKKWNFLPEALGAYISFR